MKENVEVDNLCAVITHKGNNKNKNKLIKPWNITRAGGFVWLYFVFITMAGLTILSYIVFKVLEWAENTLESIQVLKISFITNHKLNPLLLIPSVPAQPHPHCTHKFFQPRKIFLMCLRVEFTALLSTSPSSIISSLNIYGSFFKVQALWDQFPGPHHRQNAWHSGSRLFHWCHLWAIITYMDFRPHTSRFLVFQTNDK